MTDDGALEAFETISFVLVRMGICGKESVH